MVVAWMAPTPVRLTAVKAGAEASEWISWSGGPTLGASRSSFEFPGIFSTCASGRSVASARST